MTILMYRDGRIVVDNGNPLEGVSLDGLLACVTDPAEGQVLTYNGTMWVNADLPEPPDETEPAGEAV